MCVYGEISTGHPEYNNTESVRTRGNGWSSRDHGPTGLTMRHEAGRGWKTVKGNIEYAYINTYDDEDKDDDEQKS